MARGKLYSREEVQYILECIELNGSINEAMEDIHRRYPNRSLSAIKLKLSRLSTPYTQMQELNYINELPAEKTFTIIEKPRKKGLFNFIKNLFK